MRVGSAEQRFLSLLLLTVFALLAAPEESLDWPQWRGPFRTGAAATPFYEGEPPDRLTRLWEREVGGGYSGPVVAGDRVWVHSRQGGRETVLSFRLSDGIEAWRQSYEAPFRQDHDALAHGLGPYATPALADGRLFTFGVTAVLTAWNAETGELLWRKKSADEFDPAFAYFGTVSSPLVWGDLCFVHLGGHERRHISTPARGPMVALRVSDGREVWRWNGDGPAIGASPVIASIGGEPQLFFKTKKGLVGLDPRTGKEHWRLPFPVRDDNTIVTPLLIDDLLVTSDYDVGMIAWRIERIGASWQPREIWRQREASLFMSSPVLAGGLVVGFSHLRGGQLVAVDPETGQVLWRGEPRSGEHATLIASGRQLLMIREDGALQLGEVDRTGFRHLGEYPLGPSAVWSHPAVVRDTIVFRTGSQLVGGLLERHRWRPTQDAGSAGRCPRSGLPDPSHRTDK